MSYQSQTSIKANRNTIKSESMELEKPSSISRSVTELAKDTATEVGKSFGDIGAGLFEQLLAGNVPEQYRQNAPEQDKTPKMNLERGTLFSYREVEEQQQMNEIKELIKAIGQEVEQIKHADKSLMSQVADIEKLTIGSLPDRPGIYHVRFLEVVLTFLQSLKLKIGESGTWMQALQSKKAKRGSAFAVQSKKSGTQYSMSQEITASRNVQ